MIYGVFWDRLIRKSTTSFERAMSASNVAIWLSSPGLKRRVARGWPDFRHLEIMSHYMGVSINGGTPIAGWFLMEYSIKMDDDWGYPYDYLWLRKPRYEDMFVDGLEERGLYSQRFAEDF